MDEYTQIKVDGALTTYGQWMDRVCPDKDCRRDVEWELGDAGAVYRPEGDDRCKRLFDVMERIN